MMKNTKRSSKRKRKMNKKEYKKWLGLLCAMIGLCVILLSVYYWRIRETANSQHSYLQIEASEEQFQDKTGYTGVREMEQQFIVDENELTEFNVMFRKLEQQAEEPVQVELLKATDREQIQKWEIDGNTVGDYSYQTFHLSVPLEGIMGEKYIIHVTIPENSAIVPAVTNYEAYGEHVKTDGNDETGCMVFNLQATNAFLKNIYACVGVILCLSLVAFGLLLMRKEKRVEWYFLVLGLFMGSMYIVLFPPNTAPDEHSHIATAYYDANKILFRNSVDEEGYVLVRKTDAQIQDKMAISLADASYYYNQLLRKGGQEPAALNRGPLAAPFVAHLPQAVGIAIGWLFHANGMITLYLGKITALLFYLLCVFWAVRFMPWGKMVMAVIALFPMSLEIASSYSYDCTVNALSFLFIGYTMYLIYEKERVTWKDYAFLTVVGMWMAPCKLVYIFVCGIIFLIPSSKSNNPRGVLAGKIGIIVVIGMVTMLLRGVVVANLTSTPGTGYSDIERGWTLAQILEDPVNSMGVLFNTYFEQGEYYLGTIIGQSLGWLQVKISWINITGFLLCMVFALFTDKKADYMTNKQKVLVGMLSLIMIGGVVLSMWLDFTPPQWKNVAGVQGRYFLPFLPMLVLMLKGKQTLRVERYSKRIMISMYILEILTVFDVWKAMIV